VVNPLRDDVIMPPIGVGLAGIVARRWPSV
jgi:hypothetical protein